MWNAARKLRIGAQPGEWTNPARDTDMCFFDDAVGADLGIVLDHRVPNDAARSDPHPVAEDDLAFEHDVHVDEVFGHVAVAGAHAASDVDSGRIGEARSFAHEGLGKTALVEPFEFGTTPKTTRGELHAIVDAEHLLDRLRITVVFLFVERCEPTGRPRPPGRRRQSGSTPPCALSRFSVWSQPRSLPAQLGREDSGVDLRDVALLVGGLQFFDDASDMSVRRRGQFGRIRSDRPPPR